MEDDSFPRLLQAMEAGNREEAILAAHSLKGVSGNLAFARLYASSSLLAELLRSRPDAIPKEAFSLLEKVTGDYHATINAIRSYLSSSEQIIP